MKIIFPINIDRWTNPIASLLREIALNSNGINQYFSFSSPKSREDEINSKLLWENKLHKLNYASFLLNQFDIVHTASATKSNIFCVDLIKTFHAEKSKFVFTINSQPNPNDYYHDQYEWAVKNADNTVAVSNIVAEDVLRLYGRKVDEIIPNGVDIKFFDPAKSCTEHRDHAVVDTPYALFVGVITKRKQPEIVLEIAKRLHDINFLFVGNLAHDSKMYLQEIEQLPNAKYLGLVERTMLFELFHHAVALLFPSELEGLPLSVVESLSMGVPVLAQNISSLPELIENNKNGWLLDPMKINDWCDILLQLNNFGLSSFGMNKDSIRDTIRIRYDWSVISEKYNLFYNSLK